MILSIAILVILVLVIQVLAGEVELDTGKPKVAKPSEDAPLLNRRKSSATMTWETHSNRFGFCLGLTIVGRGYTNFSASLLNNDIYKNREAMARLDEFIRNVASECGINYAQLKSEVMTIVNDDTRNFKKAGE